MARMETRKFPLRVWRAAHRALVFRRRIKTLASAIAATLPDKGARLVDVGCGDGTISAQIMRLRPGLTISGLETHPRPSCAIPCAPFDGMSIPLPDNSVDGCLFVDVLHHAEQPHRLLREAARVSRSIICIKDHVRRTYLDQVILTVMDRVGNVPHGVAVRGTYFSRSDWETLLADAGLRVLRWEQNLPLYPPPFSWIFGRGLHCLILSAKL